MVATTLYDDDDDDTLKKQVENASLPPDRFGHREHVRLAWSYLTEHDDFAIAAARFRSALRNYASCVGADGKYHETITWAWLAIIREAMESCGESANSSRELLAAQPHLLDQRTLASIYDVSAIARDPIARRILVLPKRDGR